MSVACSSPIPAPFLKFICECAEVHKISFSAEKIVAAYFRKTRRFGRRRNPSTDPRMHFLGVPVKTVSSARYLGVMVNAKLNSMTHVVYIRESVANYARSIHFLSQKDQGLRGEVLKKLCKLGISRLATYTCSF